MGTWIIFTWDKCLPIPFFMTRLDSAVFYRTDNTKRPPLSFLALFAQNALCHCNYCVIKMSKSPFELCLFFLSSSFSCFFCSLLFLVCLQTSCKCLAIFAIYLNSEQGQAFRKIVREKKRAQSSST